MKGVLWISGTRISLNTSLAETRPLVGRPALNPATSPEARKVSGLNVALDSRHSTPVEKPIGPAGSENRLPVMLAEAT